MTTKYVYWGEEKVKLTWESGAEIPPRDLITSVHGFCFRDRELLVVRLNHRGWDLPGGHLEPNETPEECFIREVYEEGYVTGRCRRLGSIAVDHSENQHWQESSPYPKVGYQVFYRMDIEEVHAFEAGFESQERKFIQFEKAAEYCTGWDELYQEILEEAIRK